jgi:hypothetical protein
MDTGGDAEESTDRSEAEGEGQYEVAAIVGEMIGRHGTLYKVRYAGFGPEQDQWRADGELDCDALITAFHGAKALEGSDQEYTSGRAGVKKRPKAPTKPAPGKAAAKPARKETASARKDRKAAAGTQNLESFYRRAPGNREHERRQEAGKATGRGSAANVARRVSPRAKQGFSTPRASGDEGASVTPRRRPRGKPVKTCVVQPSLAVSPAKKNPRRNSKGSGHKARPRTGPERSSEDGSSSDSGNKTFMAAPEERGRLGTAGVRKRRELRVAAHHTGAEETTGGDEGSDDWDHRS